MKFTLKKIITCLFATIWTVLAVECYLRVFAPVRMLPRFIEEGEHGVRRNIPGERYEHSSAEYRVEFSINEQGIRDPRVFTIPKPNDVFRILLLGDSFGMGYGVSYEDSVPALLESSLSAALDRPIEVVNLSVSGFGTAEQAIVLENDGFSFEPDLVLAYWHSSDVRDNVRSQLYELDGSKLIRRNQSYLPAVSLRTWLFSFPAYRWIAEHSQFYNWVRGDVGRVAREFLFVLNDIRGGDANDNALADPDAVPKNIQLSLALLDLMRISCAQRGIPFIIAEVPTNPAPGKFMETFPDEAMLRSGYSFDVVTPIPLFEHVHRTNDGASIYWQKSAGHWTPLGANAMARSIFEHLQSR